MTSTEKVKCSNCGFDKYTGSLHIHHIDHNHENNRPENLIVLCANCHFEYHHKNSSKHKNKKQNLFDRYMEQLPNKLPGYYYQNRRIINELYEKMVVENYMVHSDTDMKEAVQNKAII